MIPLLSYHSEHVREYGNDMWHENRDVQALDLVHR